MTGLFAVVLSTHAPEDLVAWAIKEDGPPYLQCTSLEDAVCGFLRVQVAAQEKIPLPAVTLLIHSAHVAMVVEGAIPKRIGFVPATP